MAKDKPVTIDGWYRGIGKSSYLGFEEIRGLNINEEPGVIFSNKALTKESASTVDDLIDRFVKTSEGEIWGKTSENTNSVFKRTTGGTWSELTAHTDSGIDGICYFRGYVGIIIGGTIDWYDITDDTCDTSWGSSDISDSGADEHPALESAYDGKLYLGAGNVVDTIEEDTDFDPSSGATYTISKAILTLPEDYTITCLAELGNLLLIGTTKDGDSLSADIFVFNMSSSVVAIERVIKIGDDGVWDMIAVNNLVYVRGGKKGRWYVTNGTSAKLFAQIPTTLLDLRDNNLDTIVQSFFFKDLIYFPVGANSAIGKLGLYSLNPQTGAINYEHIISADETGDNDGVWIRGCIAVGSSTADFVIAWNDIDGSAYGVDKPGTSGYTSDRAFFVTQFLRVGSYTYPRSFERPEINLAEKIGTGDSIKVYYRTDRNAAWTVYGNPFYTQSTADFIQGVMNNMPDLKNVQLKVVLNNNTKLLAIDLI